MLLICILIVRNLGILGWEFIDIDIFKVLICLIMDIEWYLVRVVVILFLLCNVRELVVFKLVGC